MNAQRALLSYLEDNNDVIADVINAATQNVTNVKPDDLKKLPHELRMRILYYLNSIQVDLGEDFPNEPKNWIFLRDCGTFIACVMPISPAEKSRIDIDICMFSMIAAILNAQADINPKGSAYTPTIAIYAYFGKEDDWEPYARVPNLTNISIAKPSDIEKYQSSSSFGKLLEAIKNDTLSELENDDDYWVAETAKYLKMEIE